MGTTCALSPWAGLFVGYSLLPAPRRARGRDVQGTDWTLTSLTRSEYRTQRQASYQNYRTGPGQAEKVPADLIQRAEPTGRYYDYVCTRRKAKTSITHFQLRHLGEVPGTAR